MVDPRKYMHLYQPRNFDKQIFMGCSSKDSSEEREMTLLRLILDGFNTLCGKQQNGLQGSKFDKREDELSQEKLETITRDVAMALTGMEIEFIREDE